MGEQTDCSLQQHWGGWKAMIFTELGRSSGLGSALQGSLRGPRRWTARARADLAGGRGPFCKCTWQEWLRNSGAAVL